MLEAELEKGAQRGELARFGALAIGHLALVAHVERLLRKIQLDVIGPHLFEILRRERAHIAAVQDIRLRDEKAEKPAQIDGIGIPRQH